VELAALGGELVFYWPDPAYTLERCGDLTGTNWTPVTMSSPFPVSPKAAQEFYRLRK
jgi:hypothetical protein